MKNGLKAVNAVMDLICSAIFLSGFIYLIYKGFCSKGLEDSTIRYGAAYGLMRFSCVCFSDFRKWLHDVAKGKADL
jgi:hypothetical protein